MCSKSNVAQYQQHALSRGFKDMMACLVLLMDERTDHAGDGKIRLASLTW